MKLEFVFCYTVNLIFSRALNVSENLSPHNSICKSFRCSPLLSLGGAISCRLYLGVSRAIRPHGVALVCQDDHMVDKNTNLKK